MSIYVGIVMDYFQGRLKGNAYKSITDRYLFVSSF